MIARLQGPLLARSGEALVLESGGIGWEVFAPAFAEAAPGEILEVFCDLVLHDGLPRLYGFAGLAERDLFRFLRSAGGVGPRHALALLAALGPAGLVQALLREDAAALTAAKGVGPKLARRILMDCGQGARHFAELAGGASRAGGGDGVAGDAAADGAGAAAGAAGSARAGEARALAALLRLGFPRTTALAALARSHPGVAASEEGGEGGEGEEGEEDAAAARLRAALAAIHAGDGLEGGP